MEAQPIELELVEKGKTVHKQVVGNYGKYFVLIRKNPDIYSPFEKKKASWHVYVT